MFKLVYPGLPALNDIIRPASFALSVAPMMLFFNKILEVRSHAPRFYLVNRWLFWIYFVLFVMAVGSSAITNDPTLQKHWINANRVITPMVMVVLMLESVYIIRKGYSLAIFSLGSFFSLIFFSLVYVGLQIDWLPPNQFTTYSLYWGLAADAAFMGLSLAWRFRLFRQTMDRLMKEKEVRQQQLNIEITTWKEQQMRQFSSLLHDHIGGLIGVLRLSVDNMPLTNDGRIAVSQEIVSIANETRQYSHAFSPIPLRTQGLKAAVAILVDKIRERSQINFLFEWMGETDVQSQNVALISYHFIQEMLQNILKHAQCDQAILQIINEKNTLSIYIEDNGQGCDVVRFEQGIGLQSIRRIVDLLGGTFHVITARSEGFSLSVELPK
jgi:signal transduction histidine kinase